MSQIDGVLAVNPNESERLEQRRDLADRPDINQRCPRAQPNFGFPTPGSEAVHIIRIEHAVLAARHMNENSVWRHTKFVARLGYHAHGLAVGRMSWSIGA